MSMTYDRSTPAFSIPTAMFARWWGAYVEWRRQDQDAQALDVMPSDRLHDMGLTPRTPANRRSSGQTGAVPKAQLW